MKPFGEWDIKLKSKYGNQLTKDLIYKVVKNTLLYTGIFLFLLFLARTLCNKIIWQPYDKTYRFLKYIETHNFVMLFVWLIGFIIIVLYYLRRMILFIDTIVDASRLLIEEEEDLIYLPKELLEIENALNHIKREAIENKRISKEVEQKKNDLVVYLAHDIKTPLTSMIGYLSLLYEAEDMPSKQRKKYTQIALEKSYKLEELINELFSITRFNSQTIQLHKEKLDLSLMLFQIVDDFFPLLKEENKNVKFLKTEKIYLLGDSSQLARVFSNILKNACFYSKKESTIFVSITKESDKACVLITNEGPTISDEEMHQIFEKFYRVDSSRNSERGGSGLGLAIAKEIVQLHKGSIQVSSSDGKTTFMVFLPIWVS